MSAQPHRVWGGEPGFPGTYIQLPSALQPRAASHRLAQALIATSGSSGTLAKFQSLCAAVGQEIQIPISSAQSPLVGG